MISAKCIVVTSGKDKILSMYLRYPKVVLLKSLRKEDSSDIYSGLSDFCGSPGVKVVFGGFAIYFRSNPSLPP